MNATTTRSTAKSASAAKTGKTAAKAEVQPQAETADTAPKTAVKSAAKSTSRSTAKSSAAKEKPAAGATPGKSQDAASMSGSNASPAAADKIDPPVVSKASEVTTKTNQPTSDAPAAEGKLLSEAEILKMDEKDYMNEAQLAFFRARLQQLERDLLKNAGETTEHLRETVLVPDPADRATIEEEHALELRTRDRERKLLKKVQQALLSIDTGEYGWCEETGEPIGIPRLLARPTATLSLEAQQRRELKQKLYGD
ncbi:transcriptional regulator, TraR/DksA family [Noviherbaspirillum humi]|uniref:RNA polymerase-binding transcription factor DksA n=1 Tax=Noviherbaspirillum humi TaxID=1688639 RepID=A0A239CG37_9BURK|nr:RNA polymerase-binding protein DksA [Noviherbaspirillum humi]SNS18638.1 transcriptional regulator, TraR/DksA family [Noviherbaspirillum humi]